MSDEVFGKKGNNGTILINKNNFQLVEKFLQLTF